MSQRRPQQPAPSRREVFKTLALGLPVAALACTNDGEGSTAKPTASDTPTVPRNPDPTSPWLGIGAPDPSSFPLGMQTGDPGPDRLVAWVYAPGAASVTVHGVRWDGADWSESFEVVGTPSAEGYLHVELDGLLPDSAYALQAEVDGAWSSITTGRTAIAADVAAEVRFGASSCLDQEHGDFPSLDEVQALGPLDAFLWLGDTIYADGRVDEAGYRDLWQTQLSKGSFQRLFANVSSIFTWDDHEVTNNWSPQNIDPTRFAAAVKTFHETLPLPASVRSGGPLWRSLRFGQTVELFVLDCRGERDFDAGQYVSPEQLEWLMDGLSSSTAVWKVVATSVPITDWPSPWDILEAQLDRWDGYPGSQRAELLAHIRGEGLRGVLFVSGDLHQTTLSRVDLPGGDGDGLLEVLAGPGGSFLNTPARRLEGDQFPYADAAWSGLRVTFWPNGTARLQTVQEDGLLMFDATIDVDGAVDFAVSVHPFELD